MGVDINSISTSAGINGVINASSNAKSDNITSSSFQDMLENAVNNKDDDKLMESCREFESYFLQMMYKEMRKTTNFGEGLIPKSNAQEIFQDMLDEESSKNAANGNGLGLASMMYKQMTRDRAYNGEI